MLASPYMYFVYVGKAQNLLGGDVWAIGYVHPNALPCSWCFLCNAKDGHFHETQIGLSHSWAVQMESLVQSISGQQFKYFCENGVVSLAPFKPYLSLHETAALMHSSLNQPQHQLFNRWRTCSQEFEASFARPCAADGMPAPFVLHLVLFVQQISFITAR